MSQHSPDDWGTAEELLTQWERRSRESQFCHYEAAKYFAGLNYVLGIPVVVLTCLVGTTVFATLEKSVTLPVQVAVGSISVLAAVLAGLQTFLRFGERAEKHRSSGALYGSVRRRIEVIRVISPEQRGSALEWLSGTRETLDSLAASAPDVPRRVWQQAEAKLKKLTP